MKAKIVPLLMVLGFSLFISFVCIATQLGGLIASQSQLIAPLICGNQTPQFERGTETNYVTGQQVPVTIPYCVDNQTKAKRNIALELANTTIGLQIVFGFIFGLIIFGLAMLGLIMAARKLNQPWEKLFEPSVSR